MINKFNSFCCSCSSRVNAGEGRVARHITAGWLCLCGACYDKGSKFEPKPAKRGPASDVENWIVLSLQLVAEHDQDRAMTRNGVGFSRVDGDFAHDLVEKADKGWSPKQWAAAAKMVKKYRKQAGSHPALAEYLEAVKAS